MGSSSWLATALDHEMLEVARRVEIAPRVTPDSDLGTDTRWNKTGRAVAKELGGRYLLRYLLPHQVGSYPAGSDDRQCVTPTPYAPRETVSWLALPAPRKTRPYVMLLDPSEITRRVWGPRWIRLGKGIEYILPDGFPRDAVVLGWELEVT